MEEYFVFYEDDASELGGEGWDRFEEEDQALEFITNRIKGNPGSRTIGDYTLIKGELLKIVPIETITKLKVDYS